MFGVLATDGEPERTFVRDYKNYFPRDILTDGVLIHSIESRTGKAFSSA